MISSEIFIIKRDGKKEAFSLDKIKNAISKAFLSVGSFATQDVITNVLSRVSISSGFSLDSLLIPSGDNAIPETDVGGKVRN